MTHSLSTRLRVLASLTLLVFGFAVGPSDAQSLVETKLLASDGEAEDGFGFAVAIDDDTAIVGADYDMPAGYNSGSAYVFVLDDGSWVEQAKLVPADGHTNQSFGWAVDIDGDTAVVGARGDDDNGLYSGAVYVFVREDEAWTEQAKLLASDGEPYDWFGMSVSLDGDSLVVGSLFNDPDGLFDAGAAYVFVRQGTAWTETAKLVASDAGIEDSFGAHVALDGDTVSVGAPFDNDNGSDSGSAYIFRRQDGTWHEQAKLLASDGAAGDWFGTVAVLGDTAIVGAEKDDDNGLESGSAYVFRETVSGWTEEQKLLPDDGEAGDWFGFGVAIGPTRVLIGAQNDDAGSVYLYERQGSWVQSGKLVPSDGASGDKFGFSVSLSGDRVLVGAHGNDENGAEAGAAYAFEPELRVTVSGDCPGPVTVTVVGAPGNSLVGVAAAGNNAGRTLGGDVCAGTRLEISEPFQLPPLWIATDTNGTGSAPMTLAPSRCWLEALALATCGTSAAIAVP